MLKIIFPLITLLLLQPPKFNWHSFISLFSPLFIIMLALYIPLDLCALSPNPFLFLDMLSFPLILLTLWISPLMILASYKIFHQSSNQTMFLITMIFLSLTLVVCFATNNLFMFYIMFEASLIPTLALILGWGYQPERLQAGMYLMLYTITASLPLLISLLFLYTKNSHMSMTHLLWLTTFSLTSSSAKLWWLMTILAFMVKMPLYLSHLWLPKAHVEAPVAGSMVLAAILLKLGGYGLLRMSTIFPSLTKSIAPPFIAIAMWGAFITGMICIRQADVKSLIAYSSVGHMGLMIAGAMSSSTWGWWGALLIMIAHGLCSSALFAIANMTYEQTTTRSMFLTKGLLNLMPTMTMMWFILVAANMAAPPSLNLVGEILLLTSILATSSVSSILLALSSFLAAAYSLFLYTVTQHSPPLSSSNPLNTLMPRNLTTLILHILPLFALILNMNLSANWV